MAIDGARMLFWMTITCRNLLHLDCPGKKIKGRIWWRLVLFLISADVQCWILGIDASCTREVRGKWHEVFHCIRAVVSSVLVAVASYV